MKRKYVVLSIMVSAIIILSIVQISVSNMLSIGGIQLSQVQQQVKEYQKSNAILKEQIYTVASLTRIDDEATEAGYIQGVGQSTFVIANPQPFAIKP